MTVEIKRVYESPDTKDGKRILIDRLWPRGLTKEKAKIDVWMKDIAPSTALRQWFGHDPQKWHEFKRRYLGELKKNRDGVAELLQELKNQKVTLVYSAKDELHNDAVVLKEYLEIMNISQLQTIDEYLETQSENNKKTLQDIRKLIQKEAPGAVETISYGMPTFKLNGKNLIHFAAWRDHIAVYATASKLVPVADEVAKYRTGKGTLQFSLTEPLPLELIRKIVQIRLSELQGKK